MHPVYFDVSGDFKKYNDIPKKRQFQTFLLNDCNEIVAIGNPTQNPKILDLYKNIVFNQNDEINVSTTLNLGYIQAGDIITQEFEVRDAHVSMILIQF